VLAALALATPLPALALSQDSTQPAAESAAPAALSVSTSLGSCGVSSAQVFCTLRVSFSAIEGATDYTATITRADGSVVDYGSIGAGGAALYVPYVGPGSYSVRVSAYGPPPEAEEEDADGNEEGRGELIVSDATEASPVEDDKGSGNAEAVTGPGQGGGGSGTGNAAATGDPGADPAPPAEPQAEQPPCEPQPAPVAPPVEPPPLPEPPPEDLDPENPDEDADGIADADEAAAYELAVREQQAAAIAAQAQQPQSIECPAP